MSATMTPENAAALRKPFDAKSVGKLPKPYKRDSQKGNCAECGSYHGMPAVHLDYVGHAATTDRLLAVDPDWTWEPMATTAEGLPLPDGSGNLWIRLTVCGVTRIGVGDGSSMKEIIGDAIRNAAMRFGVALDLWSKEELESVHSEEVYKATAPSVTTGAEAMESFDPISAAQVKHLNALATDLDLSREQKLSGVVTTIGRSIESTKELTKDEATRVIRSLKAALDEKSPPDNPTPDTLPTDGAES